MSTRRQYRWALLLALLLLVVPATRARANNCADGGRSRPDEGGVGGTGALPHAPDDDEGGIGGTGITISGDTGIIGTITGFASICAGGVEIHYAADTAVEIDGQRTTSAQLAVGQVAEVIATGSGSEVRAQHIAVRHLVSGPVTRVDAEHNAIDVVGQTVQLSSTTRVGGSDAQYSAVATAFPVNSLVQVSGMRRGDGLVVASRVTATAASDVAQLTGAVTRLDSGALAIAGTPVRIDDHVQPSVGDEVRVIGRWDGSAIVARSVEALPRIPFDGRVQQLDIEGYARQSVAGQLLVGAFIVELPQAATADVRHPAPDVRVRIQAIVRDRHVVVERLGVIGDLPMLPPLPDREVKHGKGGGPGDAAHASGKPPPFDHPGQDERSGPDQPPKDHGMMVPAAPDIGAGGPPHLDRIDRPGAPQPPDRPDRPALPQLPDRPQRPEPPPRPERPQLPQRPFRSERPDLHRRP